MHEGIWETFPCTSKIDNVISYLFGHFPDHIGFWPFVASIWFKIPLLPKSTTGSHEVNTSCGSRE